MKKAILIIGAIIAGALYGYGWIAFEPIFNDRLYDLYISFLTLLIPSIIIGISVEQSNKKRFICSIILFVSSYLSAFITLLLIVSDSLYKFG